MKNKKGELGFGEIVGLVLAIAMLVFGLLFIRSQASKSERLAESQIDASALESAQALLELELEDKVLVSSKNAFTLSRGSEELFLVGVKNGRAAGAELQLSITPGSKLLDAADWVIYKGSAVKLDANKKYFYTAKLTIPDTAESGDYIFDISLINAGTNDVLETDNFLVGVK